MWDELGSSSLYLDANAFIYAVEAGNRFTASLHELFERLDSRKNIANTSELTLAEVLVNPLAQQASDLVEQYERLLGPKGPFLLAPVTLPIIRLAAKLRAEARLKLIDAIHVATAVETRCDVLITNDSQMGRAVPSPLRWLSPLGA